MLYFLSLIIALVYFYIFLSIFRFKLLYFLKKFIFRIVPELIVLMYFNFFMISIINSKITTSLSKTGFYSVANQINTIFFHKFYYVTFFDFIVIIIFLYFLFIIVKAIFCKNYLSKLKYLKTTVMYKYFDEIKWLIICFYIIYFIILFVSREYFIYSLQQYINIFTIFNIYFIINMFLMMKELEIILISDLFNYKINKFDVKDFIKDENYRIYDFDVMFEEKKYLFREVNNYLNYYQKEALTICIDGKCGCGKTSFAGVLQKQLNDDYYVFEINSLIVTENNRLNDYFNFIMGNLFKAHGIYNSKLLKNYMNIISYVISDKISNVVNYFLDENFKKSYFDLRDEINLYTKKIFDSNFNKNLDKKGIIFIVDDLERVYNEAQIVNMLIFSQYIISFDYVKFIFVTNLDILNEKIESRYLNMFIHKVFKIDDTNTNAILSKYFKELDMYENINRRENLTEWFKILATIEFDKNIKEFGMYLYNNINLEYYIFSKKWTEYKSKLFEKLDESKLMEGSFIKINFDNNLDYEIMNDYYNYIYFKKSFLGDIRDVILDNIYMINRLAKIKFDLYNDEQVIAIWICIEKKGLLDSTMYLDKEKYRIYKNLTKYKQNINKISTLVNLKLEKNPRNLKRQVSFFWYSFEKLNEYLKEIETHEHFDDVLKLVTQRDFILFFMLICFFKISNFIEDPKEEFKVSFKNNVNIMGIYKFLNSNYEDLKRCSVRGLTSFVNENANDVDIETYVSLKGFDKGINYIFLCFYIQTYIYKKMILEDVNEEGFELLVRFIYDLNRN